MFQTIDEGGCMNIKQWLVCIFLASLPLYVHAKKNGDRRCTRKQCCEDPNSTKQCYCSQICGWRDRVPADEPVFVENDPNGKGCYCKPWDRDNFNKRCKRKEAGK